MRNRLSAWWDLDGGESGSMSAEEGNNRSDRAQKLFDQVTADIATQSQDPNDERTGSTEVGTAKNIDSGASANVVDAPKTEDKTGPAAPGLASSPTEGTKESEDRLRVVVPYSQGTFDHRHELRQLGMVPNPTRKVWEGTLSSTSRLRLLELGLQFRVLLPEPAPAQEAPTPEARPVEVSGPTFLSRVQLKQLGLRWNPGKALWQGSLAEKELESMIQLATRGNLRVVSEGKTLVETLANRARREERLAREREPTFTPDRTEVLGLSDERLEMEAVEQASLAVRSYQALDGAARQEVDNRLVELGIPTDPEDAQREFDRLRGVDLEDGRTIVGDGPPTAHRPSTGSASFWEPCPWRTTSVCGAGTTGMASRPSGGRKPLAGRTTSSPRARTPTPTWLRPCGGSTGRWAGTSRTRPSWMGTAVSGRLPGESTDNPLGFGIAS